MTKETKNAPTINLRKLTDATSVAKAAEALGRTQGCIYAWLSKGEAPLTAELTAEALLARAGVNCRSANGFAILRGNLEQLQALRKVAEAMSLQVQLFQDQ